MKLPIGAATRTKIVASCHRARCTRLLALDQLLVGYISLRNIL